MPKSFKHFLDNAGHSRSRRRRSLVKKKLFRFETLERRQLLAADALSLNDGLIPPSELSVISSSQYSIADAADAFDGSGLTDDLHNDNYTDGWLSGPTGAEGQWVIVDLGDTYTLDHLRAWNYNQPGWTERGIAQADIYYSTAGVGNNSHLSGAAFDSTGWQTLVSDQSFTRSPDGPAIENTDANISLPNVSASQIAIVVDSNFGGNFAGLAEMQIYEATAATYSLSIFDGSIVGGSNNPYSPGTEIAIQANEVDAFLNPDGSFDASLFVRWGGADASYFQDVNSATTIFTMPASNVLLFPQYTAASELTVVGGEVTGDTISGSTGGVLQIPGSSVEIIAPVVVDGETFAGWTGVDASFFVDVSSATTTFTMPSGDTIITATYAPVVTGNALIPASDLTVISSSQYSIADAADAFNGSGLTDDLHNDNYTDGWLSGPTGAEGQWVIVDLGDTYTLDHLRAWNYNQPGWSERGIAQADIYYSTAGVGNNSHLSGAAFDSTGWQTLVSDQSFTRSPDGPAIENTDANISLPNVSASQIAIVVDSNFGGNFAGLAEMQIYEATAATYSLSIFDGSIVGGSNNPYSPGTEIAIQANEVDAFLNPDGSFDASLFVRWGGADASYFQDVNSATTIFTMPASNVLLFPQYTAASELTVVGGEVTGDTISGSTGGVLQIPGSSVEIIAPVVVDGETFAGWTGVDASFFVDVSSATTTFTMPSGDTIITATYAPVVTGNALIPASDLTVISSSQYSIADAADAFNGSGLTDDLHNDNYTDGWLSGPTGAEGQWVIVDLGDTYTLDHLRAWNYNQPGWSERGIAQADIYYSTAGVGNNSHLSGAAFDSTGWQTLVSDQSFTRSPDGPAIENTDANISLPNVSASQIAIVVDSNFGGNFAGLAEMQIYEATAATYSLSIFDGSIVGGSNNPYSPGTEIAIQANEVDAFLNPDGSFDASLFVRWGGADASYFQDVNSATTIFTMPASNVLLFPQYTAASELTVVGGEVTGDTILGAEGGVLQIPGTLVDIVAPETLNGETFVKWVGIDASHFTDASSASTSFTMPADHTTVTATYSFTSESSLPDGQRGWGAVPGVIRNDGVDSFVIHVNTNGPVNGVTLNISQFYWNAPGGQSLHSLRDDGLGSDLVANDFVFTSEPITHNTNRTFPSHFRNDANSPEGIDQQFVGSVFIEELDSTVRQVHSSPYVGLLRSDVPLATTQTRSDDVVTSSHLVNLKTSEQYTQQFLRNAVDLSPLTQPIYDVVPDAFDFLMLFSANKLFSADGTDFRDGVAGRHKRVQVNYSGTGFSQYDNSDFYGSDGKLLSINVMDTLNRGLNGFNATHELLHQWSYGLSSSFGLGSGVHPSPYSNIGSLLGGFQWIDNGDGTFTINGDEGRADGATHVSPLGEYLMGLTDGQDIGTLMAYDTASTSVGIKIQLNEPITQDEIVSTVTLSDIQAVHGVRSPSPANSQRDFSIGFIVESHDRLLTPTEMTFYNILAERYTSDVPSGTPDYRVTTSNWTSIEPFFGNGTTWTSNIPNSAASTEFSLNVQNGSGDGDYEAGTTVTITANPAASGQAFAGWSIGPQTTGVIGDLSSPTTTYTMTDDDALVSATYETIGAGVVQIPSSQITAIASSHYPNAEAVGAVNGDGLVSGVAHNDSFLDAWLSDSGETVEEQWMIIDLGATYSLDHLEVWNYNQDGFTNRGISQADILISGGGIGNNIADSGLPFSYLGWQPAIDSQAFMPGFAMQGFSGVSDNIGLGGNSARYVAIVIAANHGGDSVGLSEIQFYGELLGGSSALTSGVSSDNSVSSPLPIAESEASPVTDNDLVLLQVVPEETEVNGSLLPNAWSSDAIDSAFSQMGIQIDEDENAEQDNGNDGEGVHDAIFLLEI